MTIEIRKAKAGDEKKVAEIYNEGVKRKNFAYTGLNKPIPKSWIAYWRKLYSSKNPNGYWFVAVDEESKRIVGYSGFEFKKDGRGRHIIDIGWVVHPDYQGMGIATKLTQKVLSFAKEKGFKRAEAEIAVPNIASVKVAKKLGFKIEGRKVNLFYWITGNMLTDISSGRC